MTRDELLEEARREVGEITSSDAHALLKRSDVVFLDVREQVEVDLGHLPGATLVPKSELENHVEQAVDRDQQIIIYCAAGVRSLFVGQTMRRLGYERVRSLAGGFERWKAEGLPWETPAGLGPDARARYARHLVIPEVGKRGQQALLDARVLCVGAGALGSPNLLYLAAAGVGTLGIVDDDVVDTSNLQRQVVHDTTWTGQLKTHSAADAIRRLNPGVKVLTHETRLTRDNALDLLGDYDLIVDGSDNFATRYLVNDACLILGKPHVHGSVHRFEGHVTTFVPGDDNPCYRDLFPTPPPAGMAPNCAQAGVLGVVPGVVGCLQATETLKLLLSIGEPLVGRLMVWDALDQRFREMRYRRDPTCAVGWANPPSRLTEYSEENCAVA